MEGFIKMKCWNDKQTQIFAYFKETLVTVVFTENKFFQNWNVINAGNTQKVLKSWLNLRLNLN